MCSACGFHLHVSGGAVLVGPWLSLWLSPRLRRRLALLWRCRILLALAPWGAGLCALACDAGTAALLRRFAHVTMQPSS